VRPAARVGKAQSALEEPHLQILGRIESNDHAKPRVPVVDIALLRQGYGGHFSFRLGKKNGGPYWARTSDLFHVKETL
jgi:hypothetical protein